MDENSLRCRFCIPLGCMLLAFCSTARAAEPRATPSPSGKTNSAVVRSPVAGPHAGQLRSAVYAAQQHIDYAEDLLLRGAVHAAEEEFTKSLWVVAQARQMEDPRGGYTHSLATALIALDEAEDFSPSIAATALEPDLRMVAVGHRTPILREMPRETSLSALVAIQQYYNFARLHLTKALGNEPAASRALFGLGRIQMILPSEGSVGNRFAQAKAMMMHLAAVEVDAENHKSANELGVLLARYGRTNEAKKVLVQSLTASPTAAAWHNLAKVCETLGDQKTAGEARQRAAVLAKQQESTQSPEAPLRWVTPAAFASSDDATAKDASAEELALKKWNSDDSEARRSASTKTSKTPWHKKLMGNLFPKEDKRIETPQAAVAKRTGRGRQQR